MCVCRIPCCSIYYVYFVIYYAYRMFCNDRSNTDEGTDLMSAIIDLSLYTIWSEGTVSELDHTFSLDLYKFSYNSGRKSTTLSPPRRQFSTIHSLSSAVGTLKIHYFIDNNNDLIFIPRLYYSETLNEWNCEFKT